MSRMHGIVGMALLGALLVIGYPILITSQHAVTAPGDLPAVSPSDDPAPAEPESLTENGVCEQTPAPSGLALEAAACARCPDYAPKCYRDRDCDAVCGGKGFGSCIWFNSCVKCCACAL